MSRGLRIALMVLMVCGSMNLLAQKPKKTQKQEPVKAAAQVLPKFVWAYLGNSDFRNGPIPKTKFDELLKQGITARDSAGNHYKVDGFTFSFAAHNLYEDSVGNLVVMKDFFSEPCLGDTISPGIRLNMDQYNLTKPGDTAYIDGIKVIKPDGGRWTAPPMRFELTR